MSKKKVWRIGIETATFNRIRNTNDFHQIVALARIANAMRFVQVAALHAKDDDSPSGSRQSFNSFLYLAAILWEGIPLVQRMARTFRSYPAFQKGFAQILNNNATNRLLDRIKPLRNQTVFHFNESAVGSALTAAIGMDTPFVSGRGTSPLDTYYNLADLVAIRLIDPDCHSEEEFHREYIVILKQTLDIAVEFLTAVDNLITEYLRDCEEQGALSPDS